MPPSSLPIIDVAPFLDNAPENAERRVRESAALHDACAKFGFFYLNISAYVDSSEPKLLTDLGRQFFDLPQHEKDKLSLRNEDGARGWSIINSRPSLTGV